MNLAKLKIHTPYKIDIDFLKNSPLGINKEIAYFINASFKTNEEVIASLEVVKDFVSPMLWLFKLRYKSEKNYKFISLKEHEYTNFVKSLIDPEDKSVYNINEIE